MKTGAKLRLVGEQVEVELSKSAYEKIRNPIRASVLDGGMRLIKTGDYVVIREFEENAVNSSARGVAYYTGRSCEGRVVSVEIIEVGGNAGESYVLFERLDDSRCQTWSRSFMEHVANGGDFDSWSNAIEQTDGVI